MNFFLSAAKAVVATAVAVVGTLYVAASDGVITQQEWIGVVMAAVGALALVFGVPNTPPNA